MQEEKEIEEKLKKSHLLTDLTVPAAMYMRNVIDAVLKDDMQTALDEIFRLAEDEIPDECAESYLCLAQRLCAECEYADGWVFFKKEYVELLIISGHVTDATKELVELEELLPEDSELQALRERLNTAKRRKQTELLIKIREHEEVDPNFDYLMSTIKLLSEDEIFGLILDNYNKLSAENKQDIAGYYELFPFWGALSPEKGVFDALKERARVFRRHYDDLVWLHEKLADARSKNVLFAILANWLVFYFKFLDKYKDNDLPEYYHPDIFPYRKDEVFVDLGAFNGDSVSEFILAYGFDYKRIYCYEIVDETFNNLEKNLANIPNIIFYKKAAGAAEGIMFVDSGKVTSSERVSEHGETAIKVVCIDDDIPEPVTFIKMDIEGAERDALCGCERQIRENHPRLAVCTYHGYDDIYAIPRFIDDIAPGYKFYMRYHGGNMIPSEFSLLAVWGEDSL